MASNLQPVLIQVCEAIERTFRCSFCKRRELINVNIFKNIKMRRPTQLLAKTPIKDFMVPVQNYSRQIFPPGFLFPLKLLGKNLSLLFRVVVAFTLRIAL